MFRLNKFNGVSFKFLIILFVVFTNSCFLLDRTSSSYRRNSTNSCDVFVEAVSFSGGIVLPFNKEQVLYSSTIDENLFESNMSVVADSSFQISVKLNNVILNSSSKIYPLSLTNSNTVEIRVFKDNCSKTYSFVFTKNVTIDCKLSSLILKNQNNLVLELSPFFVSGATEFDTLLDATVSTIKLQIGSNQTGISFEMLKNTQTIQINADGSYHIPVSENDPSPNELQIKLKYEQSTCNTYKIHTYRESTAAGECQLSGLNLYKLDNSVINFDNGQTFDPETTDYEATVDISSNNTVVCKPIKAPDITLTFNPVVQPTNGSYSITLLSNLTSENYKIKLIKDGEYCDTEYNIKINKTQSSQGNSCNVTYNLSNSSSVSLLSPVMGEDFNFDISPTTATIAFNKSNSEVFSVGTVTPPPTTNCTYTFIDNGALGKIIITRTGSSNACFTTSTYPFKIKLSSNSCIKEYNIVTQ